MEPTSLEPNNFKNEHEQTMKTIKHEERVHSPTPELKLDNDNINLALSALSNQTLELK